MSRASARTILVTGAAGFIGSSTAIRLLERRQRGTLGRKRALALQVALELNLGSTVLLRPVELEVADLGRFLDDRPRGLLPFVPFVGRRADDVLGEVMDPFLDLGLLLVEVEGEIGHSRPLHPNMGAGCDR